VSASRNGTGIASLVVNATTRSFRFLSTFCTGKSELRVARKQDFASPDKRFGTCSEHGTHQDAKTKTKGYARENALDVR